MLCEPEITLVGKHDVKLLCTIISSAHKCDYLAFSSNISDGRIPTVKHMAILSMYIIMMKSSYFWLYL